MVSKMIHCYTCGHEELSLDLVVYCTLCEESMVHRYCMDGPLVYGDEQVVWFCEECSPRFESNLEFEDGSSNPQFEVNKIDYGNCEGGTSALVPHFPTSTCNHPKPESQKSPMSPLELDYDKNIAMDLEPELLMTPNNFVVDTNSKARTLGNPDVRLEQVDPCENLDMFSDHNKDNMMNQKQESVEPNECNGVLPPEDVDVLEKMDKFSNHDKDHDLNQRQESSLPLAPKNLAVAEPKLGKSVHSNEGHGLPLRDVDLLQNMDDSNKSLPNEDNVFTLSFNYHDDTDVLMDGLEGLFDNPRTMSPSLKKVSSLPKDDISWRGKCRISHGMDYKMSIELKAHLSINSACNVANATQTLPKTLDIGMVPKIENWPKRFDELHPSDEDIGLYFFPMHASDEKLYAGLFEKMMEDDLVLKFASNDLVLRMFTSFDLPKESYCYNKKCYLWGVFSSPTSASSPNATQENVRLTKGAKFGYEKKVRRQCVPLGDYHPLKKHKQGKNAYKTLFESSNTRISKQQDGQALPTSKSRISTNYKHSSVHAKVKKKRSRSEFFSSLQIGKDAQEKLHFQKRERMEKVSKPQSYDWKDTCNGKGGKVWGVTKEHCAQRRYSPYQVTQGMESKRTALSEKGRSKGYERSKGYCRRTEDHHMTRRDYHRRDESYHKESKGYHKKAMSVKC